MFQGTMLPPSSGWHRPLKRWYPITTVHGVTTHRTWTLASKLADLLCYLSYLIFPFTVHNCWMRHCQILFYTSLIYSRISVFLNTDPEDH